MTSPPTTRSLGTLVLNSPFAEPARYFEFGEDGMPTGATLDGRRPSSYYVPVPPAKKSAKEPQQLKIGFEEKREDSTLVNRLRTEVSKWRQGGYTHVSRRSAELLEHWRRPDRERRLFFCQIEAVETAIYLTEVAPWFGDGKSCLEMLEQARKDALPRVAFKMATGTGKTTVMAMLIAWQVLNSADPADRRFSPNFLVVAPNITIRDRLRVLRPEDPSNVYQALDLVPPGLLGELRDRLRLVLTNYHAFQRRELLDAPTLTKTIASGGNPEVFRETKAQMVHRLTQGLDQTRSVVVLNDEAHHCYRSRDAQEKLAGEEKKEAEQREQEARLWLSGIEAVHDSFGRSARAKKSKQAVSAVYDLSATPFFLKGSGYPEGTLFPWVVSDFSLVDAIEAGVVKVPRVPVADNTMHGDLPVFRELWPRIREQLPKKSSADDASDPLLPKELESALQSLYQSYEAHFRRWEKGAVAGSTPPVFIVVCNNTAVSKLVYRYIGGYDQPTPGGMVLKKGRLELFSNVDGDSWRPRPVTILVDSAQLESGDFNNDDFRRAAAHEIDEFKRAYRNQFPGRDVDKITDAELLREVLNTVGKPGKLGAGVRCVVSVSMLTEGWDANTVTHILGVRAFSTQLLCEQVIGRGLRRVSYEADTDDKFRPEFADVYGVPFRFLPTDAVPPPTEPQDIKPQTRVRALPERSACRIVFPRVIGYRHELTSERIHAPRTFTGDQRMVLSTKDIPTRTEVATLLGASEVHTLDQLRQHRPQEVAFWLAKRVLDKHFLDDNKIPKHWVFPDLLAVARRWVAEAVEPHDETFPQLLLLAEPGHNAADCIYRSLVHAAGASPVLLPVLSQSAPRGVTDVVDFTTSRPVWPTKAEKSHVSHVVADTDTWEQRIAQALEEMPEVRAYVKNHNLDFFIPYTLDGRERRYFPDFLVRYDHPQLGPLNLIVEGSGQRRPDKLAKVATARDLWVPAVNNHGGYGQWAFVEITDPWNTQTTLREQL